MKPIGLKFIKVSGMLIFAFLMFSCASRKDIVYLQGDAPLYNLDEFNQTTLEPGDILSIDITAQDAKSVLPFNQLGDQDERVNDIFRKTYMIAGDGSIEYPILGKIELGGLTRLQAIALFKKKLEGYVNNPGVNLRIINFRVSVLGEVNKPGSFEIPNDRITLLEALAMAGDLTIQGKRTDVKVVREHNGVKKVYTVDLTNRDVLNSPVYYLTQNDVVYVEPNGARVQSSIFNNTVFISLASVAIALISILSR